MDELIRKQDALDALNGNVTISAPRNAGRVYTYLKMVTDRIKALPSVYVPVINVGDMIYRQDAIKAICEDGTWLERQGCTEITMAERKQRDADIIGKLPSVQPKCGHWMIEPTEEPEYCKCSECGYANLIVEVFALDGYHYCPNCGAKMERNEDGTDL